MKRTPAAVIPISSDRRGNPHSRPSGGGASGGSLPRPTGVLVVDHATNARKRVCLAGRRAAGDRSHWFEAVDADAASWTLAFSEIDLVLADTHSFQHGVQGWMDRVATGCGKPAPLVVVLSEDSAPNEIQQMLDAGAECCLPKHLPQSVLENELRWLVAQARRKALPS